MISPGATPALSLPNRSFKRLTGFDPVRQARSSRAKTKSGKDAGRVNGSAIRVTEDAARRRFAAGRAESGLTDWTQDAAEGQINIELDGRVDSVHESLRTSFETVPDAPVSKFTLSLDGGKKGLLENSENICAAPQKAAVKMVGQNGRRTNTNSLLATSCLKKRNAQKRTGAHR
jgi:hypothetical protein